MDESKDELAEVLDQVTTQVRRISHSARDESNVYTVQALDRLTAELKGIRRELRETKGHVRALAGTVAVGGGLISTLLFLIWISVS